MDLLETTKMFFPSADGQRKVELDMSDIYRLEARQSEMAIVTKVKAPELMDAFREGYSKLADRIKTVVDEENRCQIELDRRKAIITLDLAPEILKTKGLSKNSNPAGSADLRQAIIDCDEIYTSILDRLNQIKAIHKYLQMKQEAFKMCFSGTKEIFNSINYAQPDFGVDNTLNDKLSVNSFHIRGRGNGTK